MPTIEVDLTSRFKVNISEKAATEFYRLGKESKELMNLRYEIKAALDRGLVDKHSRVSIFNDEFPDTYVEFQDADPNENEDE